MSRAAARPRSSSANCLAVDRCGGCQVRQRPVSGLFQPAWRLYSACVYSACLLSACLLSACLAGLGPAPPVRAGPQIVGAGSRPPRQGAGPVWAVAIGQSPLGRLPGAVAREPSPGSRLLAPLSEGPWLADAGRWVLTVGRQACAPRARRAPRAASPGRARVGAPVSVAGLARWRDAGRGRSQPGAPPPRDGRCRNGSRLQPPDNRP